ncbi:hypothetical protein D3C79_1090950 [compost metagenome]
MVEQPLARVAIGRQLLSRCHQAERLQTIEQNARQTRQVIVRCIQVAPQHRATIGEASLTVLL